MVKRSISFLFFLLPFVTFGQQDTIAKTSRLVWEPFYKDALQKARIDKKPVLIYFKGSDWCAPCKIIEKDLFGTEKFEELAKSDLILLEVDIPRDLTILPTDKLRDNLILQHKYKVQSFPTLLFVNHRGRKIGEKKGYILTEYYYPFILNVINRYKKS